MTNAKTSKNQVHINDNKNYDNKHLLYNDSKKNYFNKNSSTHPVEDWRKKQVSSSEIEYSKSNNQYLPSTSGNVMPNKTHKNHVNSKRESYVFQNKKPGNDF